MSAEVRSRRPVAARVLASFAVVVVAFAIASGFSIVALRQAVQEANLMRAGYFPLALSLRDVVAKQDTWNTQLNHITTAQNPADIRVWFDLALRIGRPQSFEGVRRAASRAFLETGGADSRAFGEVMLAELADIEAFLKGDQERLDRLFEAIDRRDQVGAERLRDELVTRGSQTGKRLSQLERRVEQSLDRLLAQARARERLATELLVGLTILTLLVGVAMAVYARRVLRPLGFVTERAKAVAEGDLKPRPAIVSNDEIGELAATFESMVSAIARANEQLLASERLATIGKMAAHVTHEIRNPLSSIALNLELLEEELGSAGEEANALLRAIRAEVERLSGLSEEYLSVARQRRSELRPERLSEVVEEACEFVRRELEQAGCRLELDNRYEEAVVRVDEAQLKQALFNLLRNAKEATPGGGTIRVVIERAPEGVALAVEDEGTGLAEDARERLFEPFFTTKQHGTGLGLPITRQIVESHGGGIDCEPRSPHGSRFTIRLPAERPLPAPAAGESLSLGG